jgi:predicted transcriptional regulator with HTH domain
MKELENKLDEIASSILASLHSSELSERDIFNFVYFIETMEEGAELDRKYYSILSHPKDVMGFLWGMKRYITTYFQYKNSILKEVHQKLEWIQTDSKLIELLNQYETNGKNDLHKK